MQSPKRESSINLYNTQAAGGNERVCARLLLRTRVYAGEFLAHVLVILFSHNFYQLYN